MKVVKKILFIFVAIILGLVLVINAYNFISLKVLKKDVSTIFGYATLEVISGSMEPTINVGDMIVINTRYKDYKEGDIVTFYDKEGSFVTHRIVSINDEVMVTKGDNKANSLDGETSLDKIVGKHVMTIPNLGKVIKSLQSPVTLVLILVIGIIVCVYLSVDNNGKVILDEDDPELINFRKMKEQEELKNNKKVTTKKKK